MLRKRRYRCDDKENTEDDDEDIVKAIDNKIYFYAEVNTKNVFTLIELLHSVTKTVCTDHILIYINSGGGDAYAGFSAMDHITSNKIPVYTIADGMVASAATFLLLSGHKKFAQPNSYILIHQLSTHFWGKYCDLVDELENSKCLMQRIKTLYQKKTKTRPNQLDNMLNKELIIDASRAKELGFVDEVM